MLHINSAMPMIVTDALYVGTCVIEQLFEPIAIYNRPVFYLFLPLFYYVRTYVRTYVRIIIHTYVRRLLIRRYVRTYVQYCLHRL